MSTVGILGTGRMAVRIADQLLKNGHEVLLGSRDVARAQRIAEGLDAQRVRGTSYEGALTPKFVLPAMFIRDGAFGILREYVDELEGKVVLDILNPFNDTYEDFILPWDTSAGEELAKLLPKSTIVGIFKNIFWETFEHPRFPEGESDIYVIGDDTLAKRAVMGMFSLSPFRFVDAGSLKNARVVERMTLFARELGANAGFLPRVGWRFLGEPWTLGEADPYKHLIARVD